MECKVIREKLSAYLEGAVSSEETKLIEEHLNSCQACRTHLEELKKTKDLVKDLPQVEPPAWLTPKIMFRVRAEEESKRGILRKLFYPLHIKVPVEALAMVFIAVIAVYLFKAVEPEMQVTQLPAPTKPMIPREETPQPARQAAPDSLAPRERASLKESKEKEAAKVSSVPPPSLPKFAEEPLKFQQKESLQESSGEGIKAVVPLRKQELAEKKQAPPSASVERGSMGLSDAAKDARSPKKLAAAPKAKGFAAVKPRASTIQVLVKDVTTAKSEIQNLLSQFGVRKTTPESLEGREVLTTELQAPQIKEFLEKLKAIGEVIEQGIAMDISEEPVTLRIEIVRTP
jgi:hypothetical protein